MTVDSDTIIESTHGPKDSWSCCDNPLEGMKTVRHTSYPYPKCTGSKTVCESCGDVKEESYDCDDRLLSS